jgi:hypothetical protein
MLTPGSVNTAWFIRKLVYLSRTFVNPVIFSCINSWANKAMSGLRLERGGSFLKPARPVAAERAATRQDSLEVNNSS